MHGRYAKKRNDLGALAVVTLVRRVPDGPIIAQAAHDLLDVTLLDRCFGRAFAARALQLCHELAAVATEHGIERRHVQRQYAPHDFQRCEMCAEQDYAAPRIERFLHMLDAMEFRD